MSLCSQIDIISFQHSGKSVRYDGRFYSTDRYNVALSYVKNTHNTPSQDVVNPTLKRTSFKEFNLTISWTKISYKFLKVKVCEIGAENILFEKVICVNIDSKRNSMLITVKNVPAIYAISIIRCYDIYELRTVSPLLGFLESKGDEKELQQLSTNMKNLLETGALSDVIVTDGESKMHLHKLILSARSSVFEKMFQCPMKESLKDSVTIKDISFDIMKVLVNYMYSGVVKVESMNMARQLYIAADKYDIQSLKKICLFKLKNIYRLDLSMELNDVLDNLILANTYDEIVLKEMGLNFIAKKYSIIKNLDIWIKFIANHQDLAIQILSLTINTLKNDLEKMKIACSKLNF